MSKLGNRTQTFSLVIDRIHYNVMTRDRVQSQRESEKALESRRHALSLLLQTLVHCLDPSNVYYIGIY